ncbi:hypothetical protein [Amaricoccus solimangrovi]|uniref:Glycoside hydrolase family 19 catalytic domain-containing protein n=1 Tax=Amaricoccus solimangrovi TaxID=2589815 RepID=A0A501X134_9RHOB|nr:hypothetical protein [Amaricoccus solimangrovi]TPE53086.1 hypothetical protein FJM51_03420 [Amaricoccus solimangrovi]
MNRKAFFDALRGGPVFGRAIPAPAVVTCDAILDEAEKRGTKLRHLAYILATARWECGADMKPKRENLYYTSAERIRAVWPARFKSDRDATPFVRNPRALANRVYSGRLGNGPADGYTFLGRGLVQLTGRGNYARAGRELGLPLVQTPDLALQMGPAVAILFSGMEEGWFTGISLEDAERIPGYEDDRRIINGTDRAAEVARLAEAFEGALEAAGWPEDGPEPAQAPEPAGDAQASAWAAWINSAPPGALAWLGAIPGGQA